MKIKKPKKKSCVKKVKKMIFKKNFKLDKDFEAKIDGLTDEKDAFVDFKAAKMISPLNTRRMI